jgi:hypothetical protein
MAKRAKASLQKKAEDVPAPVVLSPTERTRALVFVSHDNRDAELAEAFGDMLTDVSGGTLKSFRSTDKKSNAGIGFGVEWYTAIMSHLSEATDVVALLTQQSVNRPWILYEAGVAKGKLDTTVFGVALGIPLEEVSAGPFGQFQNCSDDPDSLTKLVTQLMRRNPDAAPRDEAVRLQVGLFRDKVAKILKQSGTAGLRQPPSAEANAAKLFEEVKAMVRDLPERIEELSHSHGARRGEVLGDVDPRFLDHLIRDTNLKEGAAIRWLMIVSALSGEYPWLGQVGLEFYQALKSRHLVQMRKARHAVHQTIELAERAAERLAPTNAARSRFVLQRMHSWVEMAVEMTPPLRKITRAELESE